MLLGTARLNTSANAGTYTWVVFPTGLSDGDNALASIHPDESVGMREKQRVNILQTSESFTVQETSNTSYNIMKYLSLTQRRAAIVGDLSVDMTTAFQVAANAETTLYLGDLAYRVDGEVTIPTTGLNLVGDGDGFTITRVAQNNATNMFAGTSLTGPFGIKNGELVGNVVRYGPGYSSAAAAFRIDGGVSIFLDNYRASGFVSGAGIYQVDKLRVVNGCHITGNILTGISGSVNNFIIEGGHFHHNGFATSGGQTHEIYLLNSSGGVIRNNRIGPHNDPLSSGLNFRYDKAFDVPGFTESADWDIYDNVFDGAGSRAATDPAATAEQQKPNRNINHTGNKYINGASARFDEPENVVSSRNIGINTLTVTVKSTFPDYVMGFLSDKDQARVIHSSVTNPLRTTARMAIVFKNTTIIHGDGPAIDVDPTFGGNPAFTVIAPNLIGTGAPLSAAVLKRYQISADLNFKSEKGLRWLNRDNIPPL